LISVFELHTGCIVPATPQVKILEKEHGEGECGANAREPKPTAWISMLSAAFQRQLTCYGGQQ
jgi:hypothetical protein